MATVIRMLNSSSNWSVNPGCPGVVATTDTCPFFPGETVYQQSLPDGVCATFDPHNTAGQCSANERNDLQAGSVTRGAERGVEVGFKLISYPSNLSSASWHLFGHMVEVHGNGLPQAVIQPQIRVSNGTIGTQGLGNTLNKKSGLPAGEPRLWIDTNAGQEPHRLYDLGPAIIDQWTYLRMHFRLSTTTNGFIHLYRDDDTVPRMQLTNLVTTGGSGDYYKEANYRNVGQSGTSAFRWCGIREWDGLMPNRFTPNQPPTGTDTTPPVVTINSPSSGSSHQNTISYSVTVTDASSGLSNVWIGLGGNPIPSHNFTNPSPGTFTGSLDVSQLAPGAYTFYAAAQDTAGNQTGTSGPSLPVTVAAPPPGTVNISGALRGFGTLRGNVVPDVVAGASNVVQIGQEEVSFYRPRYYAVDSDGDVLYEVIWDGTKFIPVDLEP